MGLFTLTIFAAFFCSRDYDVILPVKTLVSNFFKISFRMSQFFIYGIVGCL